MLAEFKISDEAGRRRALHSYAVLDTAEEPAFERIVAMVKHLYEVPICAVSLVDTDRQWFKARRGLDVCGTSRSVAFCDHTIRSHEPMIIPDAWCDPRFADNPLVTGAPQIRAYLGAPLITPDGYAVGSLCAIDIRPRQFKPADAMTLTNLADIVVTELELRMRASVDMLSGLATRRAFMERANDLARANALARTSGKAHNLAVAMIDLDYFKAINDRFGHDQGDEVIRRVGAVLAEQVRPGEVAGRIGGEEFAVIIRCGGLADALARCEEIRMAIAGHVAIGEPRETVTASVGTALLLAKQVTVDDGLRRADLGLYCAKSNGRNRVGCIDHVIREYAKAS